MDRAFADRVAADPWGELRRVREGFSDWMLSLALPFWSMHGMDPPHPNGLVRGATECLYLNGHRMEPGFRRIRVQARQLFVFSEAAIRGVSGARLTAERIHRFLQMGRQEDGSWVRRLDPDGRVLDDTADLYDLAFVLLALSHRARATGDAAPLEQARGILRFLRREMALGEGGFFNTLPARREWRQQNPHMHLLEAALALWEVSRDEVWANLARELLTLFRAHLLDRNSGTLGEYFGEGWHRAAGSEGDRVEPGHQAEWIWLLDRCRVLLGENTAGMMRTLDEVCVRWGTGPETGLVRDEIGLDGQLRLGSARLWPQTEALRAHIVMRRLAVEAGDEAEAALRLAAIVRTADNLLVRYLIGRDGRLPPPGTWIDRLDPFCRPAVDRIPASSFYHVMTGWMELDGLHPPAMAAP